MRWSNHNAGKIAAMNSKGDAALLSFDPVAPAADEEFALPIPSVQTGKAYAPKWLFPKCGAQFGFGGKLVTHNSNCLKMYKQVQSPAESNMSKLLQDFDKELQQALQMGDLPTLMDRKSKQCNPNERLEYLAIKCLASGDPQDILKDLGIDEKKINFESERFLGKQISKTNEP